MPFPIFGYSPCYPLARANDGNVDFVLGDAEFVPFRENKLNVTLCIGTISHLPKIESVKRC